MLGFFLVLEASSENPGAPIYCRLMNRMLKDHLSEEGLLPMHGLQTCIMPWPQG